MRVCVFGAGGVGGHMAVLLARAGADVSVIARGAHLEAIRAKGLTLLAGEQPITATVQASSEAAGLGVQDFVLVTVKSTALHEVGLGIGPLLGPDTTVVFFQNGIPWWYFRSHGGDEDGRRLPRLDPQGALWDAVPADRLAGALTGSACNIVAPGVVELVGGSKPITMGAPDGKVSARLEALAAMLRKAGFAVDCTPRIRDAVWTKLSQNVPSGLMSTLAPVSSMALFAERACVDARFRMQAEVASVADAWGCRVQVDFGAQIAWVRSSPHYTSISRDVIAGRRPEIDSMFRIPLEMARIKGVSTPTMDMLTALAVLKTTAAGLYP